MEETTVADRVMSLIKSENLSASSFADKIGVQRSAISHISKGRNEPSLQLIKKIIQAFPGVNVEWLFMGFGNMYKDGTSAPSAVESNTQPMPHPEEHSVDNTETEPEPIVDKPTTKAPEPEPAKAPAPKHETITTVREEPKASPRSTVETAHQNTMTVTEPGFSAPGQLIVFDPRDKTFTIYKQAQ